MASNPVAGYAGQANGQTTTGRVCGPGRPRRHRSESESDVAPTVKSFARLCSRDEDERVAALEELSQQVLACLGLDRPGSARLSRRTLLHLLRLSRSCPLQEVREKAADLLRTAKVTSGRSPRLQRCLPSRGSPEGGGRFGQQRGHNVKQ